MDDEHHIVLRKLHGELMSHRRAKAFNTPVDHDALGLTDYTTAVTTPMDLGTVKQHLSGGRYVGLLAYVRDTTLAFRNALHYNRFDMDVYFDAVFLWQKLDSLLLAHFHFRDPVVFAIDDQARPHVSPRSLRAVHTRLCGKAAELPDQACDA